MAQGLKNILKYLSRYSRSKGNDHEFLVDTTTTTTTELPTILVFSQVNNIIFCLILFIFIHIIIKNKIISFQIQFLLLFILQIGTCVPKQMFFSFGYTYSCCTNNDDTMIDKD